MLDAHAVTTMATVLIAVGVGLRMLTETGSRLDAWVSDVGRRADQRIRRRIAPSRAIRSADDIRPWMQERLRAIKQTTGIENCDETLTNELWNARTMLERQLRRHDKERYEEAWTGLYEATARDVREIEERERRYAEIKPGLTGEDRCEIEDRLKGDLKKLPERIAERTRSLVPLTDEIKQTLLGPNGRREPQPPSLPPDARRTVEGIRETVRTAIAGLPTGSSDLIYTLNQISERYVPDTIAAYTRAREADPQAAERLLYEQLETIRTATLEARRSAHGGLDGLHENGRFLRERLKSLR